MNHSHETARRALVIEDHTALHGVFELLLREQGLYPTFVTEGRAGLEAARSGEPFDLILLDLRLPGVADGAPQGLDILRELRARGVGTPVIVMSAYLDVETTCAAIAADALATLRKPLELAEVRSWIDQALKHRLPARRWDVRHAADLVLDLDRMGVTRNGAAIPMTAREFRVLLVLTDQPNTIVASDALTTVLWSEMPRDPHQSLKRAMSRLRQRLDQLGTSSYIESVYGKGYRFVVPRPITWRTLRLVDRRRTPLG